jgi:hypothetical protein
MKIDFNILKKYWWVPLFVSYLGVGSYVEGARPVFHYQLQNVACVQIVAGYIQAKRANDQALIDYWVRLAQEYQCSLPPV